MNKKYLVVCNDAGAAYMMASYFFFSKKKINTILTGPALKIFKKFDLIYKNFDKRKLEFLVEQSTMIYTGTGWQTDLEKSAILLAKKHKIKVISFIDHWVNYRQRFLLNAKKILPDVILVNNKRAATQLKIDSFFKKSKIKLTTNFYKKYILKKTKPFRFMVNNKFNILLISEPFIKKIHGFSSQDIIKEFVKYLKANFKKKIILNIRMHPSQREIDFKFIKEIKYQNIILKISNRENLEEDIIFNDLVIGCNSYALIVSLWLKKKTYYFFNIKSMTTVLKNKKIKNFRYARIRHR